MTPWKRRIAVILPGVLALLLVWWWRSGGMPAPRTATASAALPASSGGAASLQALVRARFPGLDPVRADRESQRCEADLKALTRQRWEALGSSPTRDHRIAHALLAEAYGEPTGSSARLLAELAAQQPDDAELLWFHASTCHREQGCDARAAARRLVDAAPENLAHWLMLLGATAQYPQGQKEWLSQPANQEELVNILDAAARAGSQYDSRHGDAFTLAYVAMEDLPVPPSCNAAQLAAARRAASTMGMPGLSTQMDSTGVAIGAATAAMTYAPTHSILARMCQQPELATATLQSCRTILSRMAEGDSLLARGVGIGVMTKLADRLPAEEGASWREREREHRWMMERYAARAMDFDSGRLLAMMAEGEVASIRAELARRGEWPPPADWKPARR